MPDGGGADERGGARGMGDDDGGGLGEQRVQGQGGELGEEKEEWHEMDHEACAPAEEAPDLLLSPVRPDPGARGDVRAHDRGRAGGHQDQGVEDEPVRALSLIHSTWQHHICLSRHLL